MKGQRARFTDRLDQNQKAILHVMNNVERAYQHLLWSLAKTTKLALDATDHVIEQEMDASSDLVDSLVLYKESLTDRLWKIQGQLDYAEEYHSRPWWRRIGWAKPTCDRGYDTWDDYAVMEDDGWVRAHSI